ncbi:MAG: methionyl-tRNA formyltransferase [Micrococcaceae bacterium]
MKILYAGTPDVAVPVLDGLINSEHEIVAVLTRPDVPLGRKKTMTPSPVAQCASKHQIPVIKATKITADVQEQLQQVDADIAVVVAYGALIPQNALEIFHYGWLNIHFSLLPQYRGAAPVQRAIMQGETTSGVSIFELEAGMDTGPLYDQWECSIDDTTTSGELLEKLATESTSKLLNVLADIEAGKQPQPQVGTPTIAPKLTLEDAHIDFSRDATTVIRQINGVTPEPGAWALLDGKRFKIHRAVISTQTLQPNPGQLVFIKNKPAVLLVGTADQAIELIDVQAFGKQQMKATDFARGAQLSGKVLT